MRELTYIEKTLIYTIVLFSVFILILQLDYGAIANITALTLYLIVVIIRIIIPYTKNKNK